MQLVSVCENRKIPCDERQRRALKAFDDAWRPKSGTSAVFDWRHDEVWTRNFVGVVQVPGLTVEILPKIDKQGSDSDDERKQAKHNLLYMLSFTRLIPFEERELAALALQRMPLMEALLNLFATRLLHELRCGIDHAYVRREENLPCIKGKIVMNRHLLVNSAHQERFYVGYDEFFQDTPLNQILKATSRRLIFAATSTETQRLLMETTAIFDEVGDIIPDTHHFDRVHLHRNNERFQPLLDFCRLVWQGMSPNPSVGESRTFSMLFPMEQLFEQFIACCVKRYAGEFGFERRDVRIQSKSFTRYLLREASDNTRKFKLQPDLLITNGKQSPKLILDTKWKCLKADVEDRKNGVPQADMYQMYAYANRFDCADNVLLYPDVTGVTPKTYLLEGAQKRIRVETINLNLDFSELSGRYQFRRELLGILTKVVA